MARKRPEGAAKRGPDAFKAALSGASASILDGLVSFEDQADVVRISTGHPYLDWILGTEPPGPIYPDGNPGMIPSGVQIEIYGEPSAGKSLLAAVIAAVYQQNKQELTGRVLWEDAERCFNRSQFETIGGQTGRDKLLVHEPACGEDAFEMIGRCASDGLIDLAVVDSVQAMDPRNQTFEAIMDDEKRSLGDHTIGVHARMMSDGLKKLMPVLKKHHVNVIYINQMRVKTQGNVFRNDSAASNALRFYSAIRWQVTCNNDDKIREKRKDPFTGEMKDELVELRPTVRCVKNKTGIPERFTQVTLRPTLGYDMAYDVMAASIGHGWTPLSGSWIDLSQFSSLVGLEKVHGKNEFRKVIEQNSQFRELLIGRVIDLARTLEKPQSDEPAAP